MGRHATARPWLEEAIGLAEETGSVSLLPNLWTSLGEVLVLDGEVGTAVPLCRKALLVSRRADPRAVASAVTTLAQCAAALGDHRRAAQLTGAHDVLDTAVLARAPRLGYQWSPWALQLWDEHRARLLEALGAQELERCLELGRRLSVEEACDLALGRTSPK